jgi:predicted oxidoreductase
MRYTLLFFLLTRSILSYSQFFVGNTKEFAKAALQKRKIKFTEDKVTDTTNRISWILKNEYQMIPVLNTNNMVTRQTLIPEKENEVNEFVKWFNKDRSS